MRMSMNSQSRAVNVDFYLELRREPKDGEETRERHAGRERAEPTLSR